MKDTLFKQTQEKDISWIKYIKVKDFKFNNKHRKLPTVKRLLVIHVKITIYLISWQDLKV